MSILLTLPISKYVIEDKTIVDGGELEVSGKIGWYILSDMLNYDDQLDIYRTYRINKTALYLATNETYPLGRFVGGSSDWANFDAEIIENLKLRLKVERVTGQNPESELISKVEDAAANKNPILFYFWYPHQLFSKLSLTPVYLPPFTDSCHSLYNQQNGLVDCDYPTEILKKLTTSFLATNERLSRFITRFNYDSKDQISIMGDIFYNNYSLNNACCKWLQNNTKIIDMWTATTPTSMDSTVGIVIGSLIALVIVIVLLVCCSALVGLYWNKKKRKHAMRYAPRNVPLSIVFTDIQNSTLLWSSASEKMKNVLHIHNLVMRSNIEKYRGFEVKTHGDSFMVAFSDPILALGFCDNVQKDLLAANWPSEMLEFPDMKEVKWNEQLIYRGPRVRMGVHFGDDCDIQKDKTTNRIDYFGNMVNKASRIESQAIGGRVYASSEFVAAVKERAFNSESSSMNSKTSSGIGSLEYTEEQFNLGNQYSRDVQQNLINFEKIGDFDLKGIEGKHAIYSVKNTQFPRTAFIDQFENCECITTINVTMKIELIEEIDKYISDPVSISEEKKNQLLHNFVIWTTMPTQWVSNPIHNLFEVVSNMIQQPVK